MSAMTLTEKILARHAGRVGEDRQDEEADQGVAREQAPARRGVLQVGAEALQHGSGPALSRGRRCLL